MRLLTSFPWLVSTQTLNELEGLNPGPHVQHGLVHVVTLEHALVAEFVKCGVVLCENQSVKTRLADRQNAPVLASTVLSRFTDT